MHLHPNSEADEHWTRVSELSALAGTSRWRRFRLATGVALVRAGLRVAPSAAIELLPEAAPAGCH